jgi:hypothetical protein
MTSNFDSDAVAPVSGEIAILNRIKIQPKSVLFRGMKKELKERLENGKGILYFNHHFAVRKDFFMKNKLLRDFWQV